MTVLLEWSSLKYFSVLLVTFFFFYGNKKWFRCAFHKKKKKYLHLEVRRELILFLSECLLNRPRHKGLCSVIFLNCQMKTVTGPRKSLFPASPYVRKRNWGRESWSKNPYFNIMVIRIIISKSVVGKSGCPLIFGEETLLCICPCCLFLKLRIYSSSFSVSVFPLLLQKLCCLESEQHWALL